MRDLVAIEQARVKHAATVRMRKFDMQKAEVRAILWTAVRNPKVPARVITVKEARSLAK